MKLHLSRSLRKAILATFAVLTPLIFSLSAASVADEASPITIKWDDNWDSEQKPEDGTELIPQRMVDGGGYGYNTFGGEYRVLSADGMAPILYAVAFEGRQSDSAAVYYNAAAGGYALEQAPDTPGDYSLIMDVSGTFEAVAGGDVYDSGRSWGSENAPNNRYITVREGSSVGVVAGWNLTPRNLDPAFFYGNTYVSVYTNGIQDSVSGRSAGAQGAYSTFVGDSHVYIYKAQPNSSLANVHAKSDLQGTILWSTGNVSQTGRFSIAGGGYDVGGIRIFGDSNVTVDLADGGKATSFVKSLVGGSANVGTHIQYGDSFVNVLNADSMQFTSPIVGQSLSFVKSDWFGNSTVNIQNSPSVFSGPVIGGNFEDLLVLQRVKQREGDTKVYIDQKSSKATFSKLVCSSHAFTSLQNNLPEGTTYYSDYQEDADLNIFLTGSTDEGMTLSGSRSISLQRDENSKSILTIEGGQFQGRVLAGDYLYDEDNLEGAWYQNGNGTEKHYIAHYSFWSSIGGTQVNISGGTFSNTVQGGTYVYAQNYGGSSSVTHLGAGAQQELLVALRIKTIEMNLTGGNFVKSEGTAIIGGFDVTDTKTKIENAVNYLNSTLDAEVESISITVDGASVQGEIIGGSHIKACMARIFGGARGMGEMYAIRQGDVTLNLVSGRLGGSVYAAGYYDGGGGRYDSITAPISTESVTVNVGNEISFGKISVSGGYKSYISANSATPWRSVVTGDKTLCFTDPVTYTNLTGVAFSEFNVVEVTEARGDVTLNQPLHVLYSGSNSDCRKTGAGTLRFSNAYASIASTFTVEAGRLALAGDSNNYQTGTVINELRINPNAVLDISAGNCGTRGYVELQPDSVLEVGLFQDPTQVTSLTWGDRGQSGIVSVKLVNGEVDADGRYTIKLFNGLSQNVLYGLDLMDVTQLGLNQSEFPGIVCGARAEDRVEFLLADGHTVSMNNAFLVLDKNGVLSLTTGIGRTLYWTGGDSEWNREDEYFVTTDPRESGEPVDASFRDKDTVCFVGAGNNVKINSKLTPGGVTVDEGDFTFSSDSNGVLQVGGALRVMNGASLEVQDSVTLSLNPTGSYVTVGDGSTLTVNNDLEIGTLNNAGDVNINGSLRIANNVTSGGTLSVEENLELQKSAVFDNLTAGGTVSFDSEESLTIREQASIARIAGGTLIIEAGGESAEASQVKAALFSASSGNNAFVELTEATRQTLTGLSGSGDLRLAKGATLVLVRDSSIGNLDATDANIELSGALQVEGTLSAHSVRFVTLGFGSLPSYPVVFADTINCDSFYLSSDALKDIHFLSGGTYTLVEERQEGETDLEINDTDKVEIDWGRFHYEAIAQGRKITLEAAVAVPDYYAKSSSSQNGETASAVLDSLFADGSVERIAPNGALASVIVAMDTMLEANDKAGADRLAVAASGASNAALGAALSDDVHRQLKAIRNRTTTMGVSEEETHEGMPTFNAWINAEGNYHKLSCDGTFAGYTLSSWGGTVGVDVDFTNHLTAGLAVTAMYGDYTSDSADHANGDFDTQYLTFFARYSAKAWVHTLVATFGRADVSVSRTVSAPGVAYTDTGDTDGTAYGFMYEIGRVFAVNEDASVCLEPIVNFTFTKSTLGSFTETGSDAAVATDDLEMTRFVIGAGARMQGIVGTTLYNRSSILEGRALVKANLGDNSCEATNRFVAGGVSGAYESAEQGSVGFEVGIGITVPVGGEGSSVFADFSADISSGYSNLNGTVGYRVNF